MNHNDNEIQHILTGLGTALTPELVSGRLCGLVCEVCPLRAWKSSGMTPVSCEQLLAAATPLPRQNRWPKRLKTRLSSAFSTGFNKNAEKNRSLPEYPGIGN